MSNDLENPLEHACALVGRFQYHFAHVEQKIDQAVIKLLDLDEKAATIVTGGSDFAKKLNFVRTYANEQADNEEDKKFGEKTCGQVFAINDVRQLVIRSSFDPAPGGGVQFRRTVAKDGSARIHEETWDDKKFSELCENMSALEMDLEILINRVIRPGQVPPFKFDWSSPPAAPVSLYVTAPTVDVTTRKPPPSD